MSAFYLCSITGNYLRKIATIVFLATALISFIPVVSQYGVVVSRAMASQPLAHGPGREIAEYLREENNNNEPVYMMVDHIAYWFIGLEPLTKASTHPSNISKEPILRPILGEDVSTIGELKRILDQKPRFIVKKNFVWYLKDRPAARNHLDRQLAAHYKMVKKISGRHIYRRNL